jgi:poly(3-hydroxybutyrate) depolymerase
VAEQAHVGSHGGSIRAQVVAEHPALTAADGQEAGAQSQQRRLAGPVRTLEQDDLADVDPQARPGECRELPEQRDRVDELDDRWRGRGVHGREHATARGPRIDGRR